MQDDLTRKEFLKRTSAGVLGLGLAGGAARWARGEDPPPQPVPRPRRTLGRTGIQVTPIGFGAARTMEPGLVRAAVDAGINFLDTGRSYSNGRNEIMLGETLREMRDRLVIQSKARLRIRETGDELRTAKVSAKIRETLGQSLDASLEALQTDRIDILLLHGMDRADLIHHEAVVGFFAEAKKKGKIRACGFSSHTNQVELLRAANERKIHDVIMVPYNPAGSFTHSRSGHYSEWDQPALEKEMRAASKAGIAIVAMKTCSGGPHSLDG
jgi:aryl-alcohol dehydrogenase-like predicted oxidoreductase